MAITVNEAFREFLSDFVNLDPSDTKTARSSRDNLIDNLNGFSGDDDFFRMYEEKHLKFGSFERKTKIRPLDDIDLMICISGEGRTYSDSGSEIYINAIEQDSNNNLCTVNTRYLNSTKVINRYISKLSDLSDYSKAEMHKNQEAATLKLKSYTWNFDIVPCFYTDTELYLISDGSGNWKKTDPRIDNTRTSNINQNHKGQILNVIRLIKYWNKRKVTTTIPSYMLEVMILNYYDGKTEQDNYWPDLEFKSVIRSLSTAILSSVRDPKGFQGDLNEFDSTTRLSISSALKAAADKGDQAWNYEKDKDQKNAIQTWGSVFGSDFPEYTGD